MPFSVGTASTTVLAALVLVRLTLEELAAAEMVTLLEEDGILV